jgi:VIT1/CCC1 family predicted Fe2+/Mn2+ transporter
MKKMSEKSYSGAIVLGLNDALVELSGALVGLSFALYDSRIIAAVGLITGVAAALSMAASEYLSAKEDKVDLPLKSATYTGIAYLLAVLILVSPYFLVNSIYVATSTMLILVVGIIASYTKYESSKHKESFSKKFFGMLAVTLSVSIISFLFSLLVKRFV